MTRLAFPPIAPQVRRARGTPCPPKSGVCIGRLKSALRRPISRSMGAQGQPTRAPRNTPPVYRRGRMKEPALGGRGDAGTSPASSARPRLTRPLASFADVAAEAGAPRQPAEFALSSSNTARLFRTAEGPDPHGWSNRIIFPTRRTTLEKVTEVAGCSRLWTTAGVRRRLLTPDRADFAAVEDYGATGANLHRRMGAAPGSTGGCFVRAADRRPLAPRRPVN
jgi:hypothetical protein